MNRFPLQARQNAMNVKENVCSFENLYRAMDKCANGVRWKSGTVRYLNNGLINTEKLRQELLNGTYKIGGQIQFRIYEPKVRDVVALKIKDRQFQKSLLDNYVYDELTRHFIYDNVACIKKRGSGAAVRRLKVFMAKAFREFGHEYYVYQFDIAQFFASTRHSTAKAAIRKRIRDDWAVKMIYMLIDSFPGNTGIGLGSEIAQFIELSVLDDIDHMIKEKLHERFYLRYMDDFLIIGNNKARLRADREAIEMELSSLGLALNAKKTKMFPISRGIKWQGFLFRQTATGKIIMTIDKQKIYHERRRLKKLVEISKAGRISRKDCDACFESWLSRLRTGNNYNVKRRMVDYYRKLWRFKKCLRG